MEPGSGGEGPPRLWRHVAAWVAPPGERPVMLGELAEGYERRRGAAGTASARAWYRRQVLGFVWRAWSVRRLAAPEREGGRMSLVDGVRGDLQWALRSLSRRPTFTAVVIVTLALGFGSTSAILTLVSAHFLVPLPYQDPDRLVLLWETGRNTDRVSTVSPGNYWRWREETSSFQDVAAYNVNFATLSGSGAAERVSASVVSPHFFRVLGVRPALGADFEEAQVAATDGRVALLSHALWVRRYGSDPTLIGRDIRIDGTAHTVIGVMPRGFRQPERSLSWQRPDVWRPLRLEGQRENYGSRYLRTVARLQDGVSVARAREEMRGIAARLEAAFPAANAGRSILVRTLDEYLLSDARPLMFILLAAGAIVLVIVCANVANLTLARGEERRGEFAVRAALGSGAARLYRQIAVEAAVLSLAGAVAGLALVLGAQGVLQAVQARYVSGLVEAVVDWRVLGLTLAVAATASLLFGLPLARAAARPELRAALVDAGGRGGSGRRAGATRRLLVVGQVGLATTLLVLAALLARSYQELVDTPTGLRTEGVVTFSVTAPRGYEEADDVARYHRDLLAEIEAIPGVVRVGRISDLPFTTENRSTTFRVSGRVYDPTALPSVEYHVMDPGYAEVLAIPLLRGQPLPEGDVEGELPILINERMAQSLWPDQDPIGARMELDWGEGLVLRVSGILANTLDDGFDAEAEPAFLLPLAGVPQRSLDYVVATESPGDVLSRIPAAVARVDPDVPAANLRRLEALLDASATQPRAASMAGMTFALLSLLVAAAGIYGVLTFAVKSRTREIGIRAALGASRGQLISMVLGHSGGLVAAGLVLGVIGALVSGRALSGVLYGVRIWDPPSLAMAVVLLSTVAALASWLPARQAVRIAPTEALRTE